jgi:hypothetical protein
MIITELYFDARLRAYLPSFIHCSAQFPRCCRSGVKDVRKMYQRGGEKVYQQGGTDARRLPAVEASVKVVRLPEVEIDS